MAAGTALLCSRHISGDRPTPLRSPLPTLPRAAPGAPPPPGSAARRAHAPHLGPPAARPTQHQRAVPTAARTAAHTAAPPSTPPHLTHWVAERLLRHYRAAMRAEAAFFAAQPFSPEQREINLLVVE